MVMWLDQNFPTALEVGGSGSQSFDVTVIAVQSIKSKLKISLPRLEFGVLHLLD